MLSTNELKRLSSLKQLKFRKEEAVFLVEGEKMVEELCHNREHRVKEIYGLKTWFDKQKRVPYPSTEITSKELARISSFKTPNQVVALLAMEQKRFNPATAERELCLVLDQISDPGNLGTIIRTADWFGIRHIVCSLNSVDQFNPKVIQATMGSFRRTSVYYEDLAPLLSASKEPIFGTLLKGENLYSVPKSRTGFIIIGNESQGISPEIQEFITNPIHIPAYDPENCAESLNASVAAAVVMAEFCAPKK